MTIGSVNVFDIILTCAKQNKKQVVFVVSAKKVLKKVKKHILNNSYLKLELS